MNSVDFEETSALDLFSGTGSISLELLSRGCTAVTSVEMDTQHHAHLKKCCATLKDDAWRIVRDDAFRFIRRCTESYDLIFADPPYALKGLPEIIAIALAGGAGAIAFLLLALVFDVLPSDFLKAKSGVFRRKKIKENTTYAIDRAEKV